VTEAKLDQRRLEVKGSRIRYFVGGTGRPLVLVHGLGGAASNWAELAPLLAPRHRLVIPDLPGHGGSEPLPAVGGLQSFADRVFALMERENAVPAPVVGHSFGGLVAVRLALRYPDAVSALVLAASAGLSIGRPWLRELITANTLLRPGRLAGRYRSRVSRSPLLRKLVFGFVSVADPVGLADSAVEGFLAGQLLHTDTASAWWALRRDDPRQELDQLRCPVLLLWGAEDMQLPLEDAFEYVRRLRAPLRTIAGCGHLLIGERPDVCADAIDTFLAGLNGGSRSATSTAAADRS
jgi:pimeloyl-ACP methyl ester carboxylesterase